MKDSGLTKALISMYPWIERLYFVALAMTIVYVLVGFFDPNFRYILDGTGLAISITMLYALWKYLMFKIGITSQK